MNAQSLQTTLSNLNIGGLRYFDSIGSTNDEALAWAAKGARDFSIVVADEQTSGRGRLSRKWFTPAQSALAVSLILRPDSRLRPHLSRVVGLAALSIAQACAELNLAPRIKWSNDILSNGKKLAGILVETTWSGAEVEALVIGMGINIHRESVPPAEFLQFPATSIEDELGNKPPAREEILRGVLSALVEWRGRIGSDAMIETWENALAFRGEQVQIQAGNQSAVSGELVGLESDGSLRLRDARGEFIPIRFGDVSLRPAA